ncbi:Hsp20/alpha crystallin family protein [Chitinophagaceae bacterium LB-8]|uniref:Hsp20/alpha crystallin family protein n=1 Tax=Paraflavisolibacter caeni TaxID=2982496 RepID=A0A9X2XYB7_9BACT|nr:Hsp20/alpha crystallin family protein [Paraflavisolibacter caeni]MCU7551460.1 Hsp20/alpha crystallin family protein [Paraflavisolibacter caeni]
MTLVRTFNRPQQKSFNNLIDDFFYGIPSLLQENTVKNFRPFVPVNITESETGYQLEVIAPGFNKEEFKIDLDKNLLTISAERKAEEGKDNVKNIRKEYEFKTFKRTFTVNENIDTQKIGANFKNGVLTVELPKKVEVKEPVKQITVQ